MLARLWRVAVHPTHRVLKTKNNEKFYFFLEADGWRLMAAFK